MELVQFVYTKATDGSVSNRDLVVMSRPSQNYAGYDVTGMSEIDFANFVRELNALQDKQKLEMLMLVEKYDLRNSYRQFVPERMSQKTSEHI